MRILSQETRRSNWNRVDSTENLQNIAETDHILIQRGILHEALTNGWESYSYRGSSGWRYPVSDLNDRLLTHRFKAAHKSARQKYAWLPTKPEACTYYVLPHIDLKQAIAAADGVLYIANGEPALLSYAAAGIQNVLCWFGENSVPKTLTSDLQALGVQEVRYPADRDAAGTKSAVKVRDRLKDSGIAFHALQWPEIVPEKGDANDLWIAVQFDARLFRETLHSLEALILPVETKSPRPISNGGNVTYHDSYEYEAALQRLKEDIAVHLGLAPGADFKADGWTKRAFRSPFREDRRPSATYNILLGMFKDFGSDETLKLSELAKHLGLSIPKRRHHKKAPATDNQSDFADQIKPIQLPTITASKQVNLRFISDIEPDILDTPKILVKSAINTGKTELIKQHIVRLEEKLGRKPRVLVLTHLVALGADIARRLNCELYKAFSAQWLPQVQRLVISYDSVHKLVRSDGTLPDYDLVVIDEIEQFLPHLWGGTMRSGEPVQAYQTLMGILQQAEQIIGLDAHLSQTTIDWFKQLNPSETFVVENTYRHEWGELTIHRHEEEIIHQALATIGQNTGPVVITTNSRKSSEIYRQMICNHLGLSDGEILVINSWTSESFDTQAFLQNINQRLPKLRGLICSPSVATGIDIQQHVAGVFGIFFSQPTKASDNLQMLLRYRNAGQRHAFIQNIEGTRETGWQTIYETIATASYATAWKYVGMEGIEPVSSSQRDILMLQAQFKAAANRQLNQPLSYFVALAQQEGLAIKLVEERHTATRQNISTARDHYRNTVKCKTLLNEPVSFDDLELHRLSGTLTYDIRYGHERFKLEDLTGQMLNDKAYDLFHSKTNRQALRRLCLLITATEKLKELDTDQAYQEVLLDRRGHFTATQDILLGIIRTVYGERTAQQLLTGDFSALINQPLPAGEIVEKLTPWLDNHLPDIQWILDRRSDLSTDPIKIFQRVFRRFGMRLCRRQVMQDGQRFMIYWLDADSLGTWLAYAQSRLRHLEEKEVQRITWQGITTNTGRDSYIKSRERSNSPPPRRSGPGRAGEPAILRR